MKRWLEVQAHCWADGWVVVASSLLFQTGLDAENRGMTMFHPVHLVLSFFECQAD